MFTHPQFNRLKLFFKKVSETELKNKLSKFFPNYEIIFTDLGRSAFQLAIKNLNLENSEMLVPAYICDIFSPIFKKYNIKPIYLDIDLKNFHINPNEIEKRITPKTKSILVCHTYGILVDMNKILKIAEKYNLKVIEDCAHLPPKGLSQGIRGNCAFFSFSKVFPVINSGMLVCKPSHQKSFGVEGKKPFKLSNIIKFLRLFPFLASISEKFRKPYEKTPQFSTPRKASQRSLNVFNWYLSQKKQEELAEYFHKKLKELGFQSSGITYISALVPENINRDKLFNKLKKKGIYCSRIWYKPLFPNLPNTSEAAKRIINFPFQTWFSKKNIDEIIKAISDILSKKD